MKLMPRKLRPTYHRINGVKPRGEPRLYAEELCIEVIDLMDKGLFNCEIAAYWGISEKTFYVWKKEYPDFNEACEIGATKGKARQIQKFKAMEAGEIEGRHSFNAAKLLASNEYGLVSGDPEKASGTNININMLYSNKSEQELLEILKQKNKLLQRFSPQEIEVLDVTPEQIEKKDE